ncbi:hypothetical protein QQZ08_012420 [Neonectria magnoliae]|uniref:3-phytase n=1 Tax=Neonectria magnoliae TaxID=2732573 RepID=A0ABR1H2R3_9HYPO
MTFQGLPVFETSSNVDQDCSTEEKFLLLPLDRPASPQDDLRYTTKPAVPRIARFWYPIGAKLRKLWSPRLDVRQAEWIPAEFWSIPPRVVGGDGLLDDVRNGVQPREVFTNVDPWALDNQTLMHHLQVRYRIARELQSQFRRTRRWKLVLMAVVGIPFLCILGGLVNSGFASSAECKTDGSCIDISRTWGYYSPVFSVPSDIDSSLPESCEVTFGLVLSRHGARYPTAHKSEMYNATITRLQSSVTKYGEGFGWLGDYVYSLGAADLTDFGQEQLIDSGKAFYKRYEKLAQQTEPFIRASGSERVVMSSYNFTQGFYSAEGDSADNKINDILIVPEEDGINNTLSHGNCGAFEEGWASKVGDEAADAWRDMFVPSITERLNKNLPGVNLTLDETLYMMDLCPFNTVNTPDGATRSEFCDMFTKKEWRSYDYYGTLSKYYSYGNGNLMGPTQGVGYANELIARLTKQPVIDHTNTNTTLDSSPETFPLDRALYADFSHDNTMVSVFSALGLYNETERLPTDHIVLASEAHGFSSAWVVPFGARMYVEKLNCTGTSEEYVRVLVNDRVMSLKTCGGDKRGRCKLSDFVESLSFARDGGHWDWCAA